MTALQSIFDQTVPNHNYDGTYRAVAPRQTLAHVMPLMPLMGITRIADVTGLDSIGIPVVMVSMPNGRSVSVAQGKGLTLDAAKASGLMEAVERYCAETITLPLKLATYYDLCFTHHVLNPDRLPRIKDSLFHGDFRLLWIEGYDLIQNEYVWIPYEMAHMDYTLPPPSGSGCFPASSTGIAAGNHLLEAIVHAICEAVERDASALAAVRQDSATTRLNLDSVDDPACRMILDQYAAAGILVAAYDITSDVGLPAFQCTILDAEDQALHRLGPASGMGCHTTRQVALLRALTEAAQSRLTYISGARDDLVPDDFQTFQAKALRDRHLAIIQGTKASRAFGDTPSSEFSTFNEALAFQRERLKAAGIHHAVLIDLTKQPFGIPVVRVIIPELEDSNSADRLLGNRALLARGVHRNGT